MRTRLDKLNSKIEILTTKKQVLEARQREKLANFLLSLDIEIEIIIGLLLQAPQLITPETQEAWRSAGQKFLSNSRSRKTATPLPTPYACSVPKATPFEKRKTNHEF